MFQTLSTLKSQVDCQGSSEGKCSPACPRYTTNGCECAKSWVQEGYEEPWFFQIRFYETIWCPENGETMFGVGGK